MFERMPWSPTECIAALALVIATWMLAGGLLVMGSYVGILLALIAGWLTVGLVATTLNQTVGGEG